MPALLNPQSTVLAYQLSNISMYTIGLPGVKMNQHHMESDHVTITVPSAHCSHELSIFKSVLTGPLSS